MIADVLAHGVLVGRLSAHWSGKRGDRAGVVFGFGGVGEAELLLALAVIADAVEG